MALSALCSAASAHCVALHHIARWQSSVGEVCSSHEITLKMMAALTRCCLPDSLGCTHFETNFCYKSTFFSRFYYPSATNKQHMQAPVHAKRRLHRVLKQFNKPRFPALLTFGASLHPPIPFAPQLPHLRCSSAPPGAQRCMESTYPRTRGCRGGCLSGPSCQRSLQRK